MALLHIQLTEGVPSSQWFNWLKFARVSHANIKDCNQEKPRNVLPKWYSQRMMFAMNMKENPRAWWQVSFQTCSLNERFEKCFRLLPTSREFYSERRRILRLFALLNHNKQPLLRFSLFHTSCWNRSVRRGEPLNQFTFIVENLFCSIAFITHNKGGTTDGMKL
jgi:hypothetical protein